MSSSGKYSELLRSPFYIDVIISQGIDIDKAGDVNEFRDYIWKYCICLNEKTIGKQGRAGAGFFAVPGFCPGSGGLRSGKRLSLF